MVQIQLWVIRGPVQAALVDQANAGVGGFVGVVERRINEVMNGTSVGFAQESNKVILGVQDGINNDLVSLLLLVHGRVERRRRG